MPVCLLKQGIDLIDLQSKAVRAGCILACAILVGSTGAIFAKDRAVNQITDTLIPGIWVDPDGCEHWVLDDGVEGYMSLHVTRDGKPVCGRKVVSAVCAVVPADLFFGSNQYALTAQGAASLTTFFKSRKRQEYQIDGHTDSRGSGQANLDLSLNRAHAVAAVAKSAGAKKITVRGFGEGQPIASNGSSSGRAKNRRVEIQCVE